MPQDTASILKDPNFANLSPQERIKVLNTVDSNFMGLPDPEKMKVVMQLGGGPQLTPTQTAALKRENIPVNASPTFIEGQKAVLQSKFEQAQPQSTAATRTREATIGILEPFTIPNLFKAAKAAYNAQASINANPFKLSSYQPALDLVEGAVTAPLEPVKNWVEGLATGDYDRAAYGSGGILSQTVPAVEGGVAIVKKLPGISQLRETSRNIAQNLTSTSAFKTTAPIVEKFNTAAADTAARQATSDAAIAERNQNAATAAAEKTAERNADFAQREADRAATQQEKVTEFEQKEAGKQAEFKQTAEETMKANREALRAASRDAAVNRSIEEGSKVLGERVQDLDLKLREEANAKYDVVKKATMKKDAAGNLVDPGVPIADMAAAAEKAKTFLRGSAENIKQFKELIRKSEEGEGVMIDGKMAGPGDPIYDMLNQQGALETGGNISFDDLQGYSSEIGKKLAKGGLDGDVYQALKYMKQKIDAAKALVAERNGVGPQLQNAEGFWRDYQELLYDPESSLTKVREAVGVKNPSEMANEFFRNKGNEIAVGRLKQLRSIYGKDAAAVADLAQNLSAAREEAAAYRATRQQQLPNRPAPGRAPAPLKPGESPQPVVATTTPRKIIEGPEPPTAADIVAEKRQRVEAKGRNLMEISKYDAGTLAAAPIGVLLGHPFLGLAPLAAKYGLSFLLTRPSIIEWIAKPTFRDLAAIEKMPIAEQGALRAQLQAIMDQESAGGRAVQPAGAIRNFLQRTVIVSKGVAIPSNSSAGVKNRRDALEALGTPAP